AHRIDGDTVARSGAGQRWITGDARDEGSIAVLQIERHGHGAATCRRGHSEIDFDAVVVAGIIQVGCHPITRGVDDVLDLTLEIAVAVDLDRRALRGEPRRRPGDVRYQGRLV